jgi:hypothetical protein
MPTRPEHVTEEGHAVIPGLVPGIQPTTDDGAVGTVDPGDKRRDDGS